MHDIPLRRGILLLNLVEQYPAQLAQGVLERWAGPWYANDAAAFVRDLAYLKELGFLEEEEQRVGGHRTLWYRLTATGLDIAHRVTTHPGIRIEAGK